MILADTSAWVEYDRATGSPADNRLTELITDARLLRVTEPVVMEVLSGARDDAREVASGSAPEELRTAVDSWAEGFAQSYAAAFKTLNGHARRPTMVRDINRGLLRLMERDGVKSIRDVVGTGA